MPGKLQKHTEEMLVNLHDFLQAVAKSVLQIPDDGAIFFALSFEPSFGSLQGFSAFSQLLLNLHVLLVESEIFIPELRSISGIRDNLFRLSDNNCGRKMNEQTLIVLQNPQE